MIIRFRGCQRTGSASSSMNAIPSQISLAPWNCNRHDKKTVVEVGKVIVIRSTTIFEAVQTCHATDAYWALRRIFFIFLIARLVLLPCTQMKSRSALTHRALGNRASNIYNYCYWNQRCIFCVPFQNLFAIVR